MNGRADGAAPRTATSPSPASHLATATAAAAADPGAGVRGTTGAAGAGAPMMPMAPMMSGPGMGGVGGGKERDLVTAKLTEDQAQLLGLDTQAEAVPGGTIARKES